MAWRNSGFDVPCVHAQPNPPSSTTPVTARPAYFAQTGQCAATAADRRCLPWHAGRRAHLDETSRTTSGEAVPVPFVLPVGL